MNSRRVLQLIGLSLLIVLFVGADTNQRFDKLGHRMMCQCGCNQVLLECNHVGCTTSEQMRKELGAALAGTQLPGVPQGPAGPQSRGTGGATPGSDDSILQSFVAKYGPVVLAAPTTRGFDRVAWIVPYLTLALGLGLVSLVVKKWKTRQQPRAAAVAALTSDQFDEFRQRARQETEL
jgi:hypothetical protein